MKPDSFARYSEFDLDIAQTTIGELDTSTNLPIRSEAVTQYIDNSVTTNQLTVRNNTVLGEGNSEDDDLVTINADVAINDNKSSGVTRTINIHSTSGLIETTAPMSPLSGGVNTATNTSLVTKSYVDDHRSEAISDNYEVHGIRTGHGNEFNADKVDGYHASLTAGNNTIPVIDNISALHIRRYLQFHRVEGADWSTSLETDSDTSLSIYGKSNTLFTLGLGSVNRRYIGNNNGLLEILNGTVAGTNFGDLKAAQFKTASSGKLKSGIKPFKSALDLLNNVEIVSYTYKGSDEPQVGFIAENTDPLLSGPNQDSMNVSSSVGVLIKAVQELYQQNAELQKRIVALENRE
jgi:hypothetical protein